MSRWILGMTLFPVAAGAAPIPVLEAHLWDLHLVTVVDDGFTRASEAEVHAGLVRLEGVADLTDGGVHGVIQPTHDWLGTLTLDGGPLTFSRRNRTA